MTALAEHIAAAWADWNGPVVESWIFGTRDPQQIAREIEAWAERSLGSAVAEVHGYHASVGAVALVRLVDGRDAAVKVHQPRFTESYLRSAHAVQEHLYRSRFPCPKPLAGPTPCGLGSATASQWAEHISATTPDAVAAMATLARLTLYCNTIDHLGIDVSALHPHPLEMRAGGTSPAGVHHPALVAHGTTPLVRLADTLVAEAERVLAAERGNRVVTHADWSPRNVRGTAHGVTIVLDMDSLTLMSEARAAGSAAVQWAIDSAWSRGIRVEEIDHLGTLYRRVRDIPFGPTEHSVFRAAALERLCRLAVIEDASHMHGAAVESLHEIGSDLAAGLESA